MSTVSFMLPRRLELKLAKLADAREERARLEEKISSLEHELLSFGFCSVLREYEARGAMPVGPFELCSDELAATYVVHDSSTPAVSEEVEHQLDLAEISPRSVIETRSRASLGDVAGDRPQAHAAAVAAAQAGIVASKKALGEHFTTAELGGLVQVERGRHLKRGRMASCARSMVDLLNEHQVELVQKRAKALRITQYLKL
jgi:hypothetical protein